ncbi:hypothetical protein JX266_012399 [Neoarthrinium moseri]|nr:hypothetical protein JX266_012399 [Neoarthrinium moseri]
MASQLDNGIIRGSSPTELAQYLRAELPHGWEPISKHLLASVASGAIPPTVFQVWLAVCKDPHAVVFALRQDVSVLARHVAIRRFGKWLRTADELQAIWQAVGETKGLVGLMANFSVDEVHLLCRTVQLQCRATGAKEQRESIVSELYGALTGTGKVPNPDSRPLSAIYGKLVPACSAETTLAFAKDKHPTRKAYENHTNAYDQYALQRLFPIEGEAEKITAFTKLFEVNRPLAVHVLQRIAADSTALEHNKLGLRNDLIIPLLRRSYHSRHHSETQQVLQIAVECAQKEPAILGGFTDKDDPLFFYAVQHWKRSPRREKAEKLLADLIGVMPEITGFMLLVHALMQNVEPALRYPLLCLSLRNYKSVALDLESEDSEVDEKLKEYQMRWPAGLFLALPAPTALHLFKRLLKTFPDGKFYYKVGYGGMKRLIEASSADDTLDLDTDVAMTFLASRVPATVSESKTWLDRAKEEIQDRKYKSGKQREWEHRASWAVSVVELAFATGSQDIVADILLWARRYNRDTNVVAHLYRAGVFFSEDSFDVLTGLPRITSPGTPPGLPDIKSAVEKGNEIMFQMLETVAMGLKEPAFKRYNWNGLLKLLPSVLQRRLEKTQILEKQYDLSKEEVFAHIWRPTIELMVKIERFGLEPKHNKLELAAMDGGLKDWELVTPTEASAMFLDKLAEERNTIWTKFRPESHPATTTLGSPWPRGLPIQLLVPRLSADKYRFPEMPYFQSRAEAVVFSDSSALSPPPQDKETRDAIGPFVEDYKFALDMFIQGAKDEEDRKARALRAWDHATTVLTGDRMSEVEAARFWLRVFDSESYAHLLKDLAWLKLAPKRKMLLPHLPEYDEDGPIEWNESSIKMSFQTPYKTFHKTCLDCMLRRAQSWECPDLWSTDLPFHEGASSIGDSRLMSFWTSAKPSSIPRSAADAMTAAAVCYLNSKYGADSSLLLKPLPSRNDIRFPPLYLDQDFLESTKESNRAYYDRQALRQLAYSPPADIMVHLAQSILKRLEDEAPEEDPNGREVAIKVVKHLTRSDHPEIARDFVRDIILNRQEDSSWHRHLFNVGYLRRLPANGVRAFFENLAAEIQVRLQQHTEGRAKYWAEKKRLEDDEPAEESVASTAPAVKVSTVKMFALMLREADYVDSRFSCDLLVKLLASFKQLDIQIAIVEALVSILLETKEVELQAFIYEALEKYAIPIASSINERRPPTERMWLAAEKDDRAIPGFYEDNPATLPPLLTLLLETTSRWEKNSTGYDRWISRILQPVVEKSIANHARWNALFVRKHGFDIAEGYLAAVPTQPELLYRLWNTVPKAITKANFEAWKQYAWNNLRPHAGLQAANNAIADDHDLQKSNPGRHWLRIWNHVDAPFDCGINQVARFFSTLGPEDQQILTQQVPLQDMRDFLQAVLEDLIMHGQSDEFSKLVDLFTQSPREKGKKRWTIGFLPVVEHSLMVVEKLRTAEWQGNPQRHPATLPQEIDIKLKMLQLKYKEKIDDAGESNVDDLVSDILGFLNEMLSDDAPYHRVWDRFYYAVRGSAKSSSYLLVGNKLAESVLLQRPQLADQLKVDLVTRLFKDARDSQEIPGREAAVGVLKGWLECPSEPIRRCGSHAVEHLVREWDASRGWLSAEDMQALGVLPKESSRSAGGRGRATRRMRGRGGRGRGRGW